MASNSIRTSKLEVERKFMPNPLLQAQLDGNYGEYERLRKSQGGQSAAQQPGALSFFRVPDKELGDEFYDYQNRLSNQGVWLRRRTTRVIETFDFPFVHTSKAKSGWQAKLRMGGDYISSQMLEAEGVENMKNICAMYLPGVALNEIASTAELKTLRKTYVVQKPFGWHNGANAEGEIRVMLDEVTAGAEGEVEDPEAFKHSVGEVELTAEIAGGESNEEHDRLRRLELARMQARLDEFVRRHAVLFPSDGVKGKLEAFFEWKEARAGFGALM